MRVLLTYGWCRTAYVAAMSLSRAGYEVYACDHSRLCMTRFSRFCKGFDHVPAPFASGEDYAKAVGTIAARRRVDAILPCHEDAILLRKHSQHLPQGIALATETLDRLTLGMDKYEIIRLAATAGLEVPRTVTLRDASQLQNALKEIGTPAILKTRHGNSGKGVVVVHDCLNAERTWNDLVSRYDLDADHAPLLQELRRGQVVGACFLAQHGRVLEIFCERYLRCKGNGMGTSVFREPFECPELVAAVERLVSSLGWTGIGHFDFIWDEATRTAALIEMNPRLWGALALSYYNGIDMVADYLDLLLRGTPPSGGRLRPPQPVRVSWVLGEWIATVDELRNGIWKAPLTTLRRYFVPEHGMRCDDFSWSDPLPLFAEAIHYLKGFIASGGSTNPVETGMLH